MKFFIPFAKDEKQEQEVYSGIKQFVSEELGATISDRHIYSLEYVHEGNSYYAEVGKSHALNGEPVIAILYEELRDLYHVCTTNRGVVRGVPILAGAHSVKSVTHFDQ